jgi:hypothetical protein
MTQPLDPHTLRQASARWPRETLNTRAAQSFLRSLADEAEREQPATNAAGMAQRLHDAACGCGDTTAGESSYWLAIARAAIREATTPDPLRAELEELAQYANGPDPWIHGDTIRSLLEQHPEQHPEQPATVPSETITWLQNRRRDCLRALRASTGESNQADYWRWQGHAELARQLLTRLGAEVPQ